MMALDMVGEQENANVRILLSNPLGGEQTLVGLAGWHTNVQDHQRRFLPSQELIELIDVAGLANYLKIGSFQDAGQALSEED
jgi:hypothetical protein